MILDFVYNIHDEFLHRPVKTTAGLITFAALALSIAIFFASCGPTDPATLRADCIDDCTDWACSAGVQPQACDACVANCKTIGRDE